MTSIARVPGPSAMRHLIVMAKEPKLGNVKRRLGQGIGPVEATRFYRTALRQTLMRLGTDRRWQTYLAVTPDKEIKGACWPRWTRVPVIAQGTGDLGVRMQRLFDQMPPGPAVLVGSDIPSIRPHHIAHAFAKLGEADAVFGPAADGGYWLVGFKRSPVSLAPFDGVPWSAEETLSATLENLQAKSVALIETLSDVDTHLDFERQRCSSQRLI